MWWLEPIIPKMVVLCIISTSIFSVIAKNLPKKKHTDGVLHIWNWWIDCSYMLERTSFKGLCELILPWMLEIIHSSCFLFHSHVDHLYFFLGCVGTLPSFVGCGLVNVHLPCTLRFLARKTFGFVASKITFQVLTSLLVLSLKDFLWDERLAAASHSAEATASSCGLVWPCYLMVILL
jgi:hypothetical protein